MIMRDIAMQMIPSTDQQQGLSQIDAIGRRLMRLARIGDNAISGLGSSWPSLVHCEVRFDICAVATICPVSHGLDFNTMNQKVWKCHKSWRKLLLVEILLSKGVLAMGAAVSINDMSKIVQQ